MEPCSPLGRRRAANGGLAAGCSATCHRRSGDRHDHSSIWPGSVSHRARTVRVAVDATMVVRSLQDPDRIHGRCFGQGERPRHPRLCDRARRAGVYALFAPSPGDSVRDVPVTSLSCRCRHRSHVVAPMVGSYLH